MVARTVKPRHDADLDAFFAGVDEVRAYLERHRQDPESRRARLSQLASELLKPRQAGALVSWLTCELASALGARFAAIWVRRSELARFECWHAVGKPSPQHDPEAVARSALASLDAAAREADAREADASATHHDERGLMVPVLGSATLLAGVWLELDSPLDAATLRLLEALAATAGMALEKALSAAVIHPGRG